MKSTSPAYIDALVGTVRRYGVMLTVLLLAGLVQIGCKSSTTDATQTVIGAEGQPVTTTIYGRVLDESGTPLSGVQISAGTGSATTDSRGFYIIRNASVPASRAVIIARHNGYFDAAKAVEPRSGGVTRIDAAMMQLVTTGTVNALAGGTVNVSGAAQVVFQPGSFVDGSGAPYNGTVNVAARFLDPRNVDYFDYFPGDNVAQTTSGNTVGLISCGVLRVAILGSAGQQLQLNPAKPATLSYPQPIDPKAPTSMPLWYFDETLGKWKQDGSATLAGGKYVGTVSHFTDWNLDYFDSTGSFGANGDVYLRVVCNGVPIEGVTITIVGDDAPGKYFVHPGGKTGPDGKLHFYRFPANRDVLVDIRSAKNQGLYWINNPIKVNITSGQKFDMGDISLDSPCPASIKGVLNNCSDTAAEGLVYVTAGTTSTYFYTKTGDFTFQVPATVALNLDAMNVNGDQAPTIAVPALSQGELRDVGTIKICGNGTPTFFDVKFTGKNAIPSFIALSQDGSLLAGMLTNGTVNVYDTKTGNIVSTIALSQNDYSNQIEFSTDNKRLMISTGPWGHTDVYDITGATGSLLFTKPKLASPHLYDDGTKVIASLVSTMGTPSPVTVYAVSDGSTVSTITPTFSNMQDSISRFGLIRSSNDIVYTDYSTPASDYVWSVGSNTQVRNFQVTGSSYSMVTSEDGETVAHSPDNATFACYDTKSGQLIGTVALPLTGREYNYQITKNLFYSTDHLNGAAIVRATNIANGTSTIRLLNDSNSYVHTIAASRDESTIAASSNTSIRIWKLK